MWVNLIELDLFRSYLRRLGYTEFTDRIEIEQPTRSDAAYFQEVVWPTPIKDHRHFGCGLYNAFRSICGLEVVFLLPQGFCTDMTGGIDLAVEHAPHVRRISCVPIGRQHEAYLYVRDGRGEWRWWG